MSQPYSLTVTLGRQVICLAEESTIGDDRVMQLETNGQARGTVALPRWYLPRVAISRKLLVVWSGVRACYTDLACGALHTYEHSDELHEIYLVDNRWILVCETSLAMIDSGKMAEITGYDHDEIITGSWWDEGVLVIEDFQNRRFQFLVDFAAGRFERLVSC
jgi:hypothetical protein